MDKDFIIKQSTSRKQYENLLPPRSDNWDRSNDSSIHFSLVIGPTQHGKDSFISSFDPNLKYNSQVKIGNGMYNCTKQFQYIEYRCDNLIGSSQGIILNTTEVTENNTRLLDNQIVTKMYSEIIERASQYCGGIHAFYFVQSLSDSPVTLIERNMIQMQAALGKDIFKSSVIIATKGNKIQDPEEFETNMDELEKLAQKYGIKGRVIDYRCPFQVKVQNLMQNKTPITQDGLNQMQKELGYCLQGFPFFCTKPHLERQQLQIKQIKKENEQEYVLMVVKQRGWKTLFICPYEMTIRKKVEPMTEQQIDEEAKSRVLEQLSRN